jgi:hypothetical protein
MELDASWSGHKAGPPSDRRLDWTKTMTRSFTTAALILLLAPSAALAQNRGGDAALGALSGAVVLGPVGAVAGAVIGYTAGPAIAHSWGFNRSSAPPPRQRRQASKEVVRGARADVTGTTGPRPAGQAEARVATSRSDASGPMPSPVPSAPVATAAPPVPVATTTPPVQTLE